MPCGETFTDFMSCSIHCKDAGNVRSCVESCRFLSRVVTTKPGVCPGHATPGGAADHVTCVSRCRADTECGEGAEKCCRAGCSHVCQHPHLSHFGLPHIPHEVNVTERRAGKSLAVAWRRVSSQNHTGGGDGGGDSGAKHVVYVVQARWSPGVLPTQLPMNEWRPLALTVNEFVTLKNPIRAGSWYRFRIAAVDRNGTRGFSMETKPIRLSAEPQAPGPPHNLTLAGSRLSQDGSAVEEMLTWAEPDSDLPITRYKLFWSKRAEAGPANGAGLEKRVLEGNVHSFVLKPLVPSTSYFVQLQAFSQWGEVKMRGERVSLYIRTGPLLRYSKLPEAAASRLQAGALGGGAGSGGRIPMMLGGAVASFVPAIRNVTVGTAYFQNGLLKAQLLWDHPVGFNQTAISKFRLEWAPKACLHSDNHRVITKPMSYTVKHAYFDIYDLRFDCHYEVRIRPITARDLVGPSTSAEFRTPPCHAVMVVGRIMPDCPMTVSRPPSEPRNLTHELRIGPGKTVNVFVTWLPPKASDEDVTGFRIIVGRMFADGGRGGLDKNDVIVQELSKATRQFRHSNLHQGSDYLVSIQAMSLVGEGPAASLEFHIPQFSNEASRDEYGDSEERSYFDYEDGSANYRPIKPRVETGQSSRGHHTTPNSILIMTKFLLLLLLILVQ